MVEVLVVDDDPVVLEVMSTTLQSEGYQVHTAGNWPNMNDILFARKIAVLLLDVNMPGLKGNTLAEIVSRNLKLPPSIVLFSGIPERELRRLTREVGAVNYISKGESPEKMLSIVRSVVQAFEHRKARMPLDSSPGKPSRDDSLEASQPAGTALRRTSLTSHNGNGS